MDNLLERLLIMNQHGLYLRTADGHIWIWQDPECEGQFVFDKVMLNSKIYGGILQAVDTVDRAIQICGYPSLIDQWNEWGKTELFFGRGGVDESRIDIVSEGRGGLN